MTRALRLPVSLSIVYILFSSLPSLIHSFPSQPGAQQPALAPALSANHLPVTEISLTAFYEEGASFHNPNFTPFDSLVSLEKQQGDQRELLLFDLASGKSAAWITAVPEQRRNDLYDLKPAQARSRYESDLVWQPGATRDDQHWCVFVSGGTNRNIDLYAALVSSLTVIKVVRITNHLAPDFNPVWSPDGTQLLFVSGRSGNGDLYLIANFTEWLAKQVQSNAASEPTLSRLTTNEQEDLFPAWSPDGARIAYSAYEAEPGGHVKTFGINILTLHPQTSLPSRLTKTENLEELRPSWSTNSQFLCCHVPLTLKRANNPEQYGAALEPEPVTAWLMFITIPAVLEPSQAVVKAQGPGDIQPDPGAAPLWLPTADAVIYWTLGTHGYPMLCQCAASDWLNSSGAAKVLLDDHTLKWGLTVSPDGLRILYLKQRGADCSLVMRTFERPAR